MTKVLRLFLAFAVSLFVALPSWAQNYPEKPIRIVVPYGPGGGTDALARFLADGLSSRLKQSVIVENLPGAGGTIAVTKVMKSPPDGYTLAMSNGLEFEMQAMASSTVLRGSGSTLTPIALLGTQPMVLVARPELGFKSLDDLLRHAKANPGKLSLASSGIGTSLYLAGVMFERRGGIETLRVPYKSAPQIVNDLIGQSVDIAILALPSALSYIKNGQLTALATTDAQRAELTSNVPALSEHPDFKGFDAKIWYGFQGAPKLPVSIVTQVGDAVRDLLKSPDFLENMKNLAVIPPKTGTAEEFVDLKAAQYADFKEALGL